eukprot:g7634.t1
MVFGFDNTGLLIAGVFGALVLKPHQLNSLGRSCGKVLGLMVGYLSNLRDEIENSKHKNEIVKIHNEVQESLATLHSIQYQVKRGTKIMPTKTGNYQPSIGPESGNGVRHEKSEKTETVDQIPVSADMTSRARKKGVRFGSEIMLDAILEEETAYRAKHFMEQTESNKCEKIPS